MTFLIFNTNIIFIHLSLRSQEDKMIQHNLFCSFTKHMINKKEQFELTHIEYYQINNQSLSSYVYSTIYGLELIFDFFLQSFLSCRFNVCTWHGDRGWGRGMEKGDCRRRDGGYIGLIDIIYIKTPHRDMTKMNRNIIKIFLHNSYNYTFKYSLFSTSTYLYSSISNPSKLWQEIIAWYESERLLNSTL